MAHDHSHSITSSTLINRSFLVGIGLNVLYVLIEVAFGFQQNSTALLSDAVHNIGDISGLILAFVAFKLLKVKPTSTFSYGLKKGSIVASFINSVLLAFAIGAIAWEGILKILNPSPLSGSVIIWVASVGVIINFLSAILFREKQKEDLNIKAAYWHLMADALVSLGVVLSGVFIHYFQWYVLDGITSVIIAIVVLFSTWQLFKDSIIAILDGTPTSIDKNEILHHLQKVEGVKDIHHLHIWGMSTSENALTCHILVDKIENITTIKKYIKEELEEHNITHSTLEFEVIEENCNETNL
ncbi:MAG: cation transporter [Sphingobacteriales bacterium]|nr:cation transporter [Sphingobacteriales bacterium]